MLNPLNLWIDPFYLTQMKSDQKKLKDGLVHTSNHLKVDYVMTEIDCIFLSLWRYRH
ncbi:hypothetical protein K4L44_08845 [Halosquirtibacter laminarini]|uniref:Uncharacterized protein n=1 Tax=Halosquirtibacter laminarini TaxID=3374600 RepID=A0AC61NK17_9BACT|nr:hypothetical protein K4L44_08845 [Prolixibacteraceae bacterium]